jgi:hypothetical protein
VRKAVVRLRPDHQIDRRLAAHDFRPFGLGDAAGHGDQHRPALRRSRLLQPLDLAKLGIDLLGRLLADMAGV